MADFSSYLEGTLLAALGAFMAMASTTANRISQRLPFVRIGAGRLTRALGLAVVFGGLIIILYHSAN